MIKVTIIMWIAVALTNRIIHVLGNSLSTEEKIYAKFGGQVPGRLIIAWLIYVLLIIAAVVCTVISVIRF